MVTVAAQVTLGQIRAFVTVASTGSFTRAADVLGLSQPALTSRIQQFEEALGVRLFDRDTRSVELTRLGRELAPTLRRLLAEFETAVTAARDSGTRVKGLVKLACLPSCASALLPELIRDFSRTHPDVSFVIRDVVNSAIPGLVRAGDVDFGIGVAPEGCSDLEWAPLLTDTLLAVYRDDEPRLKMEVATAPELARRPLILTMPGSSVREKVDEAFAKAGLVAVARCEANYLSTAKAMAQAGLGIAILPSTQFKAPGVPELRFQPIEGPGFSREIGLLQRKRIALHPGAAAFIAKLQEFARRRLPQ